eukprot:jgi/Astpho2/4554/e_gw1.00067.147.1_t
MISLALLISSLQAAHGLDNGLALKPQMAYNTWNCFGGDINEELVRTTADLVLDRGLAKAGYNYLVVDDAWSERQRNSDGRIESSKEKFPSGMKALGDYIHSKGLKFGMYSDAGSRTCLGYPGSRHNEELDAQTFADWGIDYLKYDNCWAPASDWVVDRFAAMRDALNKTGKPILYSLCEWGVADPWLWAPKVGNSWRTTGDISPTFESFLRCLDNTVGLSRFAGPGGWNDPDMLEVGNNGLTLNEQRAHFALWALLKSPLIASADLRHISKEALTILLADEVIAVNQDDLGIAGDLIWKQGPLEAYAGPMAGGSRAAVLFNRHTIGTQYPISNITVFWEDLGYPNDMEATVRDLYAKQDLGRFTGSFTAAVGIHDGLALRIIPKEPKPDFDEWRPWVWREGVEAAAAATPQATSLLNNKLARYFHLQLAHGLELPV